MKFLQSLLGKTLFLLLLQFQFQFHSYTLISIKFTLFIFFIFAGKTRFAVRNGSLPRVSGTRFYNVPAEEYNRRNYAKNVQEYNTVLGSLNAQRRSFSLSLFNFMKNINFVVRNVKC